MCRMTTRDERTILCRHTGAYIRMAAAVYNLSEPPYRHEYDEHEDDPQDEVEQIRQFVICRRSFHIPSFLSVVPGSPSLLRIVRIVRIAVHFN